LEVPENYLERYFNNLKNDQYQIQNQVPDLISFANQNVVSDSPFSDIDIISFRNLLISFKKEVMQNVLNSFHFALMPHGILFLGSTESRRSNSNRFNVLSKKWRIYKSKLGSDELLEFQKKTAVK